MHTQQAVSAWNIEQLLTAGDTLMITAEYQGIGPEELFGYWTQPQLLTQWWPQEAEIDPQVGGEYHLCWPGMDWHLRGRYYELTPGEKLGFTWKWDHLPDLPERSVEVVFQSWSGVGMALRITHSRYTDGENDQQERQGHLEGWTFFLTRLGEVVGKNEH